MTKKFILSSDDPNAKLRDKCLWQRPFQEIKFRAEENQNEYRISRV